MRARDFQWRWGSYLDRSGVRHQRRKSKRGGPEKIDYDARLVADFNDAIKTMPNARALNKPLQRKLEYGIISDLKGALCTARK
jgi:hypothetical protein